VELHVRQFCERAADPAQERAQYLCPRRGEFAPERFLIDALIFGNGRQADDKSAIGEIWTRDDILDAVQDHGAHGVKENFVKVCVKLASRKAAASRKLTDGVGKRFWKPRDIVERQH